MNPSDKSFEAKLASLRPSQPSNDLPERIAQSVREATPEILAGDPLVMPRRQWNWYAAGLAATVLLALTAIWFSLTNQTTQPMQTQQRSTAGKIRIMTPIADVDIAVSEGDRSLPTMGNFLHAMRDSTQAIDGLLQQHAHSPMPASGPLSVNDFLGESSS